MPKPAVSLPNPANLKIIGYSWVIIMPSVGQVTKDLQASNRRMTQLLDQLTKGGGSRASNLDGVKLMRADRSLPRMPVFYEPSIVIVGQGRKRGYLGSHVYTYDAHNYLVLSVPMPFECETHAAPDGPFLAVSIRVDLAVLSELLIKMDLRPTHTGGDDFQAMCSTPLDLSTSRLVRPPYDYSSV